MESDFFNGVVRKFGVSEEQSNFVTPNFRYELVEIQPALCGDGSTDGTVVATYFLGYITDVRLNPNWSLERCGAVVVEKRPIGG